MFVGNGKYQSSIFQVGTAQRDLQGSFHVLFWTFNSGDCFSGTPQYFDQVFEGRSSDL